MSIAHNRIGSVEKHDPKKGANHVRKILAHLLREKEELCAIVWNQNNDLYHSQQVSYALVRHFAPKYSKRGDLSDWRNQQLFPSPETAICDTISEKFHSIENDYEQLDENEVQFLEDFLEELSTDYYTTSIKHVINTRCLKTLLLSTDLQRFQYLKKLTFKMELNLKDGLY
jgi:hypothetical protein